MKPKKKRVLKKKFKQFRQAGANWLNQLIYILKPGRDRIINQKEIRFIGLQRSGNHAIINWLYSQAEEVKCFLNFIPSDKSPFIHFQNKGTYKEFDQGNFLKKFNIPLERLGFHSSKAMLIYSYEDDALEVAFSEYFEKNHDRWVGKSGKRFDVLLVRDPFNLFASRLKKEEDITENRYTLKSAEGRTILTALWKQYAREYLGETGFLPHNKVTINYNQWFANQDYRKNLAEKLELKFNDSTMEQVIPIGGGSSFDRVRKDHTASEMKVLERWQHYKDDPDYQAIFRDPEILPLSERIFGEIPGVREWLSR